MYYKNLALTLMTMLLPGMTYAESSSNYIGAQIAKFDSKYSSAEFDGGMMSLGYDLNNYIALEAAAGASQSYEEPVTGNTAQIDYVASAFLRFNVRFNRVTLYALGGYSRVGSTATSGSVSVTDTNSGVSYGFGIDFYGTRDLALSIRRVELFDEEKKSGKSQLGASMVGITYYFDTPKIHSRY